MKFTPKVGSTVMLQGEPPVRAYVMEANLITGKLRVKPENAEMPILVDRENVERLQDLTRRMTKDDLHDARRENGGRPTPSKPPAANLEAAEAKQTENAAAETTEQNTAAAPQSRPQRQERQQRPPRRPNNRPAQNAQNGDAEPKNSASENFALHTEFGETKQAKPQSQPQNRTAQARPAMNLDGMDFTEHRAAKPAQPAAENENATTPQERQNRDNRNRRYGQRPHGNRPNQNRENAGENGEQKNFHRNPNRPPRQNQAQQQNRPPQNPAGNNSSSNGTN